MTPTAEDLRELEAWIAEHVMGWKDVRKFRGEWMGFTAIPSTTKEECEFIPKFTTDPASAMEVLKKCLEREGVVEVWKRADGSGFSLSKDCTNTHVGEAHIWDTTADTLPLAICKFAKALFDNQPAR